MLREELDFIRYQKLSDWILVEQFSNKECNFNFLIFFFLSPKLSPAAIKKESEIFPGCHAEAQWSCMQNALATEHTPGTVN